MSNPAIQACADLVQRGDPDRFRATMMAPVAAREILFPLYAFNLEVARAAWVTSEPMIAEMRLQFWRDVIEDAGKGKAPRAHEVAAPFAALIQSKSLPVDALDASVAARRWDIYNDPFEDEAAFEAYLNDTGATLIWACALALGAGSQHEPAIRAFGRASALAALFLAVPELTSRSRIPLVDGRPDNVRALAQSGLNGIKLAQKAKLPKQLNPALWAGWRAKALLTRAVQNPYHVNEGTLPESGFSRDFGLFQRVWLNRF